MGKVKIFDSGLRVTHRVQKESAIVHVSGPLTFPDAVGLTGVIKSLIAEQIPLLLLDLTDIAEVDGTGLAVLIGVGGDLKNAAAQVRVIAPDPRLRHRLPYTLGLRKVFTSVDEALQFTPRS